MKIALLSNEFSRVEVTTLRHNEPIPYTEDGEINYSALRDEWVEYCDADVFLEVVKEGVTREMVAKKYSFPVEAIILKQIE